MSQVQTKFALHLCVMNKEIITNYVEYIWNLQQFQRIDEFLHTSYTDHSLPPALPANKQGLIQWINGTSLSFQHNTIIEQMVCEGDKVMIKIRMQLKHIGTWRDIPASGITVHAIGYRYFELKDQQITAHWGLIDGNAIENQLKEASHGCKIQV